MKNWDTLEADCVRLITRHFTPGRGGQKIKHVTIHHMAMIGGLDECWNVWQNREASAHYTVSQTGEIGQAVWDRDTAWANANLLSNQQTIAIEHSNSGGANQDWPISPETLEAGAHLVAAICKFYELGRPVSGKNVRFHAIESGGMTACPYHLRPGGKYHDHYMARAQYWYDQMTGAAQPEKAKEATPVALTQKYFQDFLTGYLGPQFDAIQEIWRQLRGPGGKGWEQLGKNAQGQNLTMVDAIAALRVDVARIEKKLEER